MAEPRACLDQPHEKRWETGVTESRGDGAAQLGYEGGWTKRIGIPRPLFWGFVGVLIFMIGDGIEISFVSKYLSSLEGGGLAGSQASFATVTAYGAAVAIWSYFSETLSSIWGLRRVMWLGAAWWIVFERHGGHAPIRRRCLSKGLYVERRRNHVEVAAPGGLHWPEDRGFVGVAGGLGRARAGGATTVRRRSWGSVTRRMA